MVFHWSLSDSKSPQVSRTLLSILAVFNNAVVWMVSTRPPTSKSVMPFSYFAKSTNHMWYSRHPHVLQLFQFSSKVEVLILLFTFFQFYSVVSRDSKVDNFANSLLFFFFVDYYKVWSSGRDLVIVCMSKSHRSLCVSFSRTGAGLCIYDLFV